MNNKTPLARACLLMLSLGLLISCGSDNNSPPNVNTDPPSDLIEATAFTATVHRTEGGFPHIIANDWGSIGFGTGYAASEDIFCDLALNLLKYRAQRAEYLGAGPQDVNLNSDFFYKYLIDTGLYDEEISPELEAMFEGYAAGFNRYLLDTGVDNLPDATCRGADWIQQMSAEDVKRIHLTPAFLPRLASLFTAATPPVMVTQAPGEPRQFTPAPMLEGEALLAAADQVNAMATARDKGSNGVAIGSDLTNHGGGILYTNPHLDWDLSFRFWPRHHIIPGVTNELGANTWERANVGFGTNGHIAWTNTVSTSKSSAVYELQLVPGNPLAYQYDGGQRDIISTEVTVNVLEDDGSLTERRHTYYESHHGLIMGLVFSWTTDTAFAMRIANEGARGINGGAIAYARSRSVRELKTALDQYQSTPSTNTIAADSNGEAFYGDYAPTANFTDQQLVDCASPTPVLISFFAPAYLGDTSACEWNTDSDSAAPGIVGAANSPNLFRSDYVTNSNSSFWLSNPNEPLTGYPMVKGDIETERSARTRSGLHIIQNRIDGTDGLSGNSYNLDTLLQQMLGNQSETAVVLRDDLVTLCTNNPSVDVDGSIIDITAACPILAAWDMNANLDSRGAHLFREFILDASSGRVFPEQFNYTVPFDAADPVNTPRGLDTTDNPEVLQSLARAVQKLNDAGIALDAQLGDIQGVTRNGEFIPLHGGEEAEGILNKMSLAFAGADGYPEVTDSSGSWIMGVEFLPDGIDARGILTYSMSTNPDSPHYSDMTELFSQKVLLQLPYTQEEVEAAALSTTQLSEGTDQCADNGWQDFDQPSFASETACRQYFADIANRQLTGWAE